MEVCWTKMYKAWGWKRLEIPYLLIKFLCLRFFHSPLSEIQIRHLNYGICTIDYHSQKWYFRYCSPSCLVWFTLAEHQRGIFEECAGLSFPWGFSIEPFQGFTSTSSVPFFVIQWKRITWTFFLKFLLFSIDGSHTSLGQHWMNNWSNFHFGLHCIVRCTEEQCLHLNGHFFSPWNEWVLNWI